jgi:hypothetical protein
MPLFATAADHHTSQVQKLEPETPYTITSNAISSHDLPSNSLNPSNPHLITTTTMPRPTTLNFITGNANKLAEVQAILSDVPGLNLTSKAVDLPELQGSIEEISLDKARRAADEVSVLMFLCLFLGL